MDSRLELASRSVVLKGILDALPDSVPSIRELRIQAQKLNRILMSPPWKESPPPTSRVGTLALAVSGKRFSTKKYNKEQGKYAIKVGEQSKKLEKMVDKSFKQWFRQTKLLMTNAEFQQWKMKLNQAISEAVGRIQKQVTDRIITGMKKPPDKPFSRIGRS